MCINFNKSKAFLETSSEEDGFESLKSLKLLSFILLLGEKMRHFVNHIPHAEHPTSRTSHIPNRKIIVTLLFSFDYSGVTQFSFSISSNF